MAQRRKRKSAMAGTLDGLRLADAPGHLLRRSHQIAVDHFVAEAGARLTPPQFALLAAIRRQAGAMQRDLVRATGIDRSTLAEMTRRLERRGLIARRRAESDGRANALTCTRAGEAALVAVFPGMIRAQARILAPIPKARRARLLADLRLLAGLD